MTNNPRHGNPCFSDESFQCAKLCCTWRLNSTSSSNAALFVDRVLCFVFLRLDWQRCTIILMTMPFSMDFQGSRDWNKACDGRMTCEQLCCRQQPRTTLTCRDFNCGAVNMDTNVTAASRTCSTTVSGQCKAACCTPRVPTILCRDFNCDALPGNFVQNTTAAASSVRCAPSVARQCASRCCRGAPPSPPPPPGSCPPQQNRTGYIVCGRTRVNLTCTVQCAGGYYGANTRYKCVVVNGRPTYRPIDPIGVCLPRTPCARYRCPANMEPRTGLPVGTSCTTPSSCPSTCCRNRNVIPPGKDCPARPPIPNTRPCPCKPVGYICNTTCRSGYKCATKPKTTNLTYKCVLVNGVPTWVATGSAVGATCAKASSFGRREAPAHLNADST
jgi:hypothetical protein